MKLTKQKLIDLIKEEIKELYEGGPGSGPHADDDKEENPFDREPSDDELADIEKQFEAKERDYKAEYKKYGSSTKAKKYRAELNKYNRQKGTYGNGDKKDASHKGGKIVGFEEQSKNRGRAEKSRLKKEEKLTEALKRFKVYVSGESKPLILLGKNEKEVKQTAYAMIRNSSVKVRKVVKEDFGAAYTHKKPYSSKEAQSIMDKSVKNYAKLLRKAEYQIIKDWMAMAKRGTIDYFDIVRGLTTGDIARAHPFELKFLKGILDRDKIMNRFRSYFKGKKGMEGRKGGR